MLIVLTPVGIGDRLSIPAGGVALVDERRAELLLPPAVMMRPAGHLQMCVLLRVFGIFAFAGYHGDPVTLQSRVGDNSSVASNRSELSVAKDSD